MTTVGLIGVPSSAGAFAPGQERAPAALRGAGLVALLTRAGVRVHDHGDRAVWRWRPDRTSPRAQNAPEVAEIARQTAERVAEAAAGGEITLVLGGDCTVGIGSVAGHVQAAGAERVGLLYFDLHADLNVPGSVVGGALDWMGVAHMLGEDGAVAEVAGAGSRTPLLAPEQVLVLGWGPDNATAFEREVIRNRGIAIIPVQDVAADPIGAAARALAQIEPHCDRLVVHFDVDVIDFTDTPLSENPGRNEGLSYDAALRALRVIVGSAKLVGLTVTELNPAHAEQAAGAVRRLALDLAGALAARAGRGREPGPPAGGAEPPSLPAPAEMAVRRAIASDAPAIGQLLHDFNREYDDPTPEPPELAARVRALLGGGDTAVLLAGEAPVGVAVLRLRPSLWTRALECYLAELYVVPALRGRGIGRALMLAAMDLARAEGADHMDLGTAETDVAARGLYESLGFDNHEGRPDGSVNFYYERQL